MLQCLKSLLAPKNQIGENIFEHLPRYHYFSNKMWYKALLQSYLYEEMGPSAFSRQLNP